MVHGKTTTAYRFRAGVGSYEIWDAETAQEALEKITAKLTKSGFCVIVNEKVKQQVKAADGAEQLEFNF